MRHISQKLPQTCAFVLVYAFYFNTCFLGKSFIFSCLFQNIVHVAIDCCAYAAVRLLLLQYADPVADLLDKWGVFQARLFRDSCVFHHGSYVKVSHSLQSVFGACVSQAL